MSSASSFARLLCPVTSSSSASSLVSKSSSVTSVVRRCPHLLHQQRNNSHLEVQAEEVVSPVSLIQSRYDHHFRHQQSLTPVIQQTLNKSTIEVKDFTEIPSARHLPLIGTTLDLMAAGGAPFLHTYCDHRHKTLGRLYREKMGNLDCVFVADSNLMAKIYSNEGQYPVHAVPEPWTLFNDMKGIQRGLFFM